MEIRPLERWMLPALAEFANRNLDLHAGRFTPELLEWHIYQDTHVRPRHCAVMVQGDRILGFTLGVVRGADAWIKVFAVDAAVRRQGIATRLFEHIERIFAQAGARRVHIGSAVPLYLMPGVDPRYTAAVCFLEQRGYRRNSDAVNMVVHLNQEDFDTHAEEQRLFRSLGVRIHRLRPEEAQPFGVWMESVWGEGWRDEALLSLRRTPVSTFVARHDDRYVGFATFDVELFWQSFGPMGVLPEYRGQGLGTVLLKRSLRDMKERGASYCEIAWVGPVAFYSRAVNARIQSIFYQFTKRLEPVSAPSDGSTTKGPTPPPSLSGTRTETR